MIRRATFAAAVFATAVTVPMVRAESISETEGNDSKAAANILTSFGVGDTITGNSISGTGTGLDYFDVTLATNTPGIYRNVFTLSSTTAGHTATIRATGQSGGLPTTADNTLQTARTVGTDRLAEFYSFGGASRLYYRVTGTVTTTADYVVTYTSSAVVTPTSLGSFTEGSITITSVGQGHVSDTEFFVYDSNFAGIAGYLNDDVVAGTAQSTLTRAYTPGTYYLAVSTFNTADNRTSPVTDGFTTGSILDFGGVVANSSTTTNVNVGFAVTDVNGTTQFPTTRTGAFDVVWFTFTVNPVPEPSTLALGGLMAVGAGLMYRRRRVAA